MQEEVTQKVIGLSFQAVKFTAGTLYSAARTWTNDMERSRCKKAESGKKDKVVDKAQKVRLRDLVQEGESVSNVEIKGKDIKGLERLCKKNGIRFAVKKDKSTNPPTYNVFFKGKNTQLIEYTLREYTKKQLNKSKQHGIRDKINSFKQKIKELGSRTEKLKFKERTR